jgi:hypothetical protein
MLTVQLWLEDTRSVKARRKPNTSSDAKSTYNKKQNLYNILKTLLQEPCLLHAR